VTVAEFGNLIAAPYATMLLADLGARVIKVEPPGGDLGRRFGPFINGESAFFMAVNRGKESLALDTRDSGSKPVLDNLVKRSDVVVHNLRRGAMGRMGLGEGRCRELNSALIYAEISAFGSTGPYADRPGIDVIFQGESGMMSITGDPDDGPRKTATTIGDYVAGTNAALAISAALAESPRRGRHIDISLRDGLMSVQSGWNALYFAGGSQPARTGTASPYLAPNQAFDASDEPFTLAIVSDRHFQILCETIERPDLADRYPTNDLRMADRHDLAKELTKVFSSDTANNWVMKLDEAGLPCGRILDIGTAFADPQARHHGMAVDRTHPVAGDYRTTGSPIRVDHASTTHPENPPVLGADTRTLLTELGVDTGTVDRMIREGKAVAP
jgi:crotonobetainyl-CoA:carnitine CoA-transferase CaiB-like acyl-CoA transferase